MTRDEAYELLTEMMQNQNLIKHGLAVEAIMRAFGVSDRIINGIKAHHSHIKPTRDNIMERAVFAADDISGLITAVALVKDRSLSNVSVESVMKKFDQKNFAAGANREQITTGVKELNMDLQEFTEIALKAMQGILRN